MNSAALTLPQRMAEDEICCACDGLSAPEALGALLEIVAQILADVDIVPGTEDYENFMLGIEKSLPPRIAQLRWDGVIPLPAERPERVADERPTLSVELPTPWDSFVPPPAERPEPIVNEGPIFAAEIPTLRDGIASSAERLERVADEVSTLSAEIPASADDVVPPPAKRSKPVADKDSILPVVRVTSAAA